MPTPLTNDRWGYESNCFVCEQTNELGLQIPFQLDDGGETVSAAFTLGVAHSGAPVLVHGGVTLAILDEAQAWACIAIAGVWALTRSTAADFDEPVFVDTPYRVIARIETVVDDRIEASATIVDVNDSVCVRSRASFVSIGEVDPEQRALGLGEAHRHLLGEP